MFVHEVEKVNMSVVLIMLDGLRPDALSAEQTPTIIQFMKRGASTTSAQSVDPSITLPCHLSIFHSVPPSRHGIHDNNWHSMARPVQNLVGHLRQHNKLTGFYHNWDFLRDLTRPGELYFNFFIDTGNTLDGDEILVQQAIPAIQEDRFDLTFIYFAAIDVAGHLFGWMSDDYLRQVSIVDRLLGELIPAIPETTHIIMHADHGGHERTHGTTLPEDMNIPWMIAGPSIKQNYSIQEPVTLLDTAPMISRLLNVPLHPQWEGRVIEDVFET
jgi:predicted AlkP superfamily pyrophosphatase or phosphodiesterase